MSLRSQTREALAVGHETSGLRVQWASETVPERIEWLWADRLPLRDLAVLAGNPGLGKSTMTADLAARVSRGELDGAVHGEPRAVLIASAEDDWSSVIWGRLKAAQADLSLVASVTMPDGELSVPGDVDRLTSECRRLRGLGKPVGLVVIDPISSFLAVSDGNSTQQVRRALAPLAKMARQEEVSVLAVAHLNKQSSGPLLDRISGSNAFGAAPRSVLAFVRDPEDPDGDSGCRRLIAQVKSNHGRHAPTLAAHVEVAEIAETGPVSRLVLDGEVEVDVSELALAPDPDRATTQDVREAIVDVLTGGELRKIEVQKIVAARTGASKRTIERRATDMEEAGELVRDHRGMPALVYWRLSPSQGAASPSLFRHDGETGRGESAKHQVSSAIEGDASPGLASSEAMARQVSTGQPSHAQAGPPAQCSKHPRVRSWRRDTAESRWVCEACHGMPTLPLENVIWSDALQVAA